MAECGGSRACVRGRSTQHTPGTRVLGGRSTTAESGARAGDGGVAAETALGRPLPPAGATASPQPRAPPSQSGAGPVRLSAWPPRSPERDAGWPWPAPASWHLAAASPWVRGWCARVQRTPPAARPHGRTAARPHGLQGFGGRWSSRDAGDVQGSSTRALEHLEGSGTQAGRDLLEALLGCHGSRDPEPACRLTQRRPAVLLRPGWG